GIPVVAHLRWDTPFAGVSRVWPFETGFTPVPCPALGPYVLHAEIYPSIRDDHLDRSLIKDQAQVRELARWLAAEDGSGVLGQRFARPVDLPEEAVAAAVAEEGWIIGA